MSEGAAKKPWEEDYGSEEKFLYAWGFHRDREFKDMWRYGSRKSGKAGQIEDANLYTKQQAFEKIAEWRDRHE